MCSGARSHGEVAVAVWLATSDDPVHIGLRPLGGERYRCRGSGAQSPSARLFLSLASDRAAVQCSSAPTPQFSCLSRSVMPLILYEHVHGASVTVTRDVDAGRVVIGVEIIFPRPSPASAAESAPSAGLFASSAAVAAPTPVDAPVVVATPAAVPRTAPAAVSGPAAGPPAVSTRRRWRSGRLAAAAVPLPPAGGDVDAAAPDPRRRRRAVSISRNPT